MSNLSSANQAAANAALADLPSITSLDALTGLVNSLSVTSPTPDSILLYSGSLGSKQAYDAAQSIADQIGASTIADTARGYFMNQGAFADAVDRTYDELETVH